MGRHLRSHLRDLNQEKMCHNTIHKMAKQQSFSSILTQHHLRVLGHPSQMSMGWAMWEEGRMRGCQNNYCLEMNATIISLVLSRHISEGLLANCRSHTATCPTLRPAAQVQLSKDPFQPTYCSIKWLMRKTTFGPTLLVPHITHPWGAS